MKILVCVSVVPDTTTKITFTENNTKFNKDGVQFIINPYDELALTRALEIAEQNSGTVTVINVGLADAEPSIRKALAVGANDAIRVNAEPVDAFFVAEQIAAQAKNGGYDMILTGRESIDYNGGLVCGLVGELMGIPSINVVTKIDVEGTNGKFTRDIDGGRQEVTAAIPFIASAQKDLVEPRIPNMRGIMGARTKPLNVVEPVGDNKGVHFANYELPPAKAGCKMIPADNAGELIELLHNEAKVI